MGEVSNNSIHIFICTPAITHDIDAADKIQTICACLELICCDFCPNTVCDECIKKGSVPKTFKCLDCSSSSRIKTDDTVGTSIYFRGQANEVVAETKANRLEPQIWQIGL